MPLGCGDRPCVDHGPPPADASAWMDVCKKGRKRNENETTGCRIFRYVLAGPGRLRQRGPGGRLSGCRHRAAGGVPGVRADCPDHGFRDRSHIRLPSQPGGFHRAVGRRPLSRPGPGVLHHRAGAWRACRRCHSVFHRQRQSGFRRVGGICVQRLRRALPGRVFDWRGLSVRGRHDLHVPAGHPRRHRPTRARGVCPDCHRALSDVDPPDQYPGHQHLRQPGPQHRRRTCSSAAGPFSSCGFSGSPRSSAPCSAGASTAGWAKITIRIAVGLGQPRGHCRIAHLERPFPQYGVSPWQISTRTFKKP